MFRVARLSLVTALAAMAGLLAVVTTGLLVVTARADEAECEDYFGAAYVAYKKCTKMFIPWLI